MLADQLFYGRTMQFTAELDAKYAALTVDQANAAIRTYFKPDALSVFLAGDFAGRPEQRGYRGADEVDRTT